MIKGVKIKKLKVLADEHGRLMEILRKDDSIFDKFGQVYMTTVKPGVIKAWHYHKKQTDNFTCVNGRIKLALYDARKNSPTFGRIDEFTLSLEEPCLIRIPPFVYHGFKCLSAIEAIVINNSTRAYNRREPDIFKVDPCTNDIPYNWKKK